MSVSVERFDELRHLLVALDPAERSLGVEHPGGGPAQHHVPVAPTGHVAVGGPGDGDHRLDWVGGDQRLREPASSYSATWPASLVHGVVARVPALVLLPTGVAVPTTGQTLAARAACPVSWTWPGVNETSIRTDEVSM